MYYQLLGVDSGANPDHVVGSLQAQQHGGFAKFNAFEVGVYRRIASFSVLLHTTEALQMLPLFQFSCNMTSHMTS